MARTTTPTTTGASTITAAAGAPPIPLPAEAPPLLLLPRSSVFGMGPLSWLFQVIQSVLFSLVRWLVGNDTVLGCMVPCEFVPVCLVLVPSRSSFFTMDKIMSTLPERLLHFILLGTISMRLNNTKTGASNNMLIKSPRLCKSNNNRPSTTWSSYHRHALIILFSKSASTSSSSAFGAVGAATCISSTAYSVLRCFFFSWAYSCHNRRQQHWGAEDWSVQDQVPIQGQASWLTSTGCHYGSWHGY